MEPVIHVHDDDRGLRNIYPLAARSEAAADLDESIAASERNRAPSGIGWTGIHIINPPSFSYLDAGLGIEDAAAALVPIMPRVRTVDAAVSSDWCFGLGSHCFIKLEPKGDRVERIWFGLAGREPASMSALGRAIQAIDAIVPSVVVDYRLRVEGPVGDASFLISYFEMHARRDAEIEDWVKQIRKPCER